MPRKIGLARFYSFIVVDVDVAVGLLLVVSVVVVVDVSVAELWKFGPFVFWRILN